MDGVHDLGGVQGFGKLEREKNEPIFHSDWERRVFGMMMTGMARGLCNLDQARHAIERMDPARYLATSYYEHWLAGIERVLLEKGIVQPGEIDARVAKAPASQAAVPRAEDPQFAAALVQGVGVGFPATRDPAGSPRFQPGDRVRVRRMSTTGHTRCPRYVRGLEGTIEISHGTHVLPDASAHGRPDAEPLYNVRFAASEVWGGEAKGEVRVDLWESYLEPTRKRKARR